MEFRRVLFRSTSRRGQTILRIGSYSDTYSANSFPVCGQRDMGKMMKKRWLAFTALLLAGAGGYWAFEANKYRIPGIVQDWNDPVQPNRAVAWQQGPTQAPEGKRPPNIILIVADDLGYNDISLNGGGEIGRAHV